VEAFSARRTTARQSLTVFEVRHLVAFLEVCIAFAVGMPIFCVIRMADSAKARYQILVVDDEPTVCKAIQMMLRYHGHDVQIANNGAAALELFETGQFDLIITDYLMPEMKGDQLVTLMKASRPGQRIIMVTAFAEDFLAYGKPTGGVDMVLNKPFSLEELRAAISQVMG
jgi:CheY-like chemotaxis protein